MWQAHFLALLVSIDSLLKTVAKHGLCACWTGQGLPVWPYGKTIYDENQTDTVR